MNPPAPGPVRQAAPITGGEAPAVSVVLPTHNRARLLPSAIRSVLGQTFRDWELIVVDDASSDETPAVIAEFARRDARVRGVRNASNLRLPRALNAGFQEARGRFFTWTSDDNEYLPEALAGMVAFLDARPEVDLVYTGLIEMDEHGRELRRFPALPPHLLPAVNVVRACFLYRRAVQEALGGYDPAAALAEDWDFWLRASVPFRLEPLAAHPYRYLHHSESLTATRAREIEEAQYRVMAERLPQLTWMTRAQAADNFLRLARRAAGLGDHAAARRHTAEAMRRHWLVAGAKRVVLATVGQRQAGRWVQWARERRAALTRRATRW